MLLALPWAGCQFVKETETALLQAQQQTLNTTAQIVSLRFAEQSELLPSVEDDKRSEKPIYFHALDTAPVIDGFDDDWQNLPQAPTQLFAHEANDQNRPALLYAGNYRQDYYLSLRVPDTSLDPLNPANDPLTSGDYLVLLRDGSQPLYLSASAPGNISARYRDRESGEKIRTDYGVSAVWNYLGDEYLVEVRIRSRLLDGLLGLEFVRRNTDAASTLASDIDRFSIGLSSSNEDRGAAFVAANQNIADQLDTFAHANLRLSVLDTDGWLLGQAGGLGGVDLDSDQHGLIRALYQFILRDKSIQAQSDWPRAGRLTAPDELQSSAIFSDGLAKISRSVLPIVFDNRNIGYVIAEQTSDSLATTTNHAFNRLLFWTLVSMLSVVAGLLLFSVWLSYRIRRLSKAADEAIDDRGNLKKNFPVSRISDEVGDLSRSYEKLLGRLNEYTDYLKTLSGKLSHELKTPLAVVRTSLDNLEQQSLPDSSRVYLERARDGASRLSAIFSALSNASRIEGIIKDADYENIEIIALIQALFDSYKDAYPDTEFSLSVPENKTDSLVYASAELIVQMLDKLVDNAVGFHTENTVVEICIEIQSEELRLSVVNKGPVLPDGMKTQLFDSMVSVRGAEEKDAAQLNLGLGLYIARLIAEAHGGKLTLDNLPDGSGVVASLFLGISSEFSAPQS